MLTSILFLARKITSSINIVFTDEGSTGSNSITTGQPKARFCGEELVKMVVFAGAGIYTGR